MNESKNEFPNQYSVLMKIHSNKQKCNKVNIISKDVCKL